MKIKFFPIFLLIFSFVSVNFAQRIVVTPRKVVYKRPKPSSEYKKSFSVVRPQVRGANLATAKKIETTISYEKNFDFSIKDEISEFQWLEEANFAVDYNKNDILGVTLTIIGSGAYPSEASQPVVVNLKTGAKVFAKEVFVKLSELAAKAKQLQAVEIKKAIVDIKKENLQQETHITLFDETGFTVKNLDKFSVSDKGVTFWYEYGFPHVIKALQPEGRYFLSWAALKPFIKRGGLLGKFIR